MRRLLRAAATDWNDLVEDYTIAADPDIDDLLRKLADAEWAENMPRLAGALAVALKPCPDYVHMPTDTLGSLSSNSLNHLGNVAMLPFLNHPLALGPAQ